MLVQVNPDTYLGIQYTTHNGDKLSLNRLLEAWVFGKSPNTAKNYLAIANKFLWWVKKDLKSIGLIDLQDYLASLKCVESTKKTKMAVLKSLLTFCHKIGLTPYNAGVLLKSQNVPDQLHSRVLSESDVQMMIRLEVSSRNRLILKTLYLLGLRVSELVGMQWGDFTTTPEKRVVLRVVGKGDKERFILVPDPLWKEITSVIDSNEGGAVFKSRFRKPISPLSPQYVWEIVKKAAQRADLTQHVSPHWLRHAHASHSLDRGAKIHQVRETLGHSSLATTSRYVKSRLENSSSLFLTC